MPIDPRDVVRLGAQYAAGPAEDEEICGETYDHDTFDTYRGADGVQWECRRCGAEGWEPATENED